MNITIKTPNKELAQKAADKVSNLEFQLKKVREMNVEDLWKFISTAGKKGFWSHLFNPIDYWDIPRIYRQEDDLIKEIEYYSGLEKAFMINSGVAEMAVGEYIRLIGE